MTLSLFNKNLIARFGQNLPQALLLVGQEHTHALDLIQPIITHFLCSANNCGTCRTCLLIQKKTHPDILFITPEKPGAAIKIDQIRKLQYEAYQTPLCADHRIIIIHPANEMNRSASNALLKVLEEPPKHLHFILIATHLDSLPNTIMSRCQSYQIQEPEPITTASTPGYLSIGLHYDESTPRGILFKKQQEIILKLCELSENKASVCQLAADWSTHALSDWLWFFQLLTATLLQHQLIPEQPVFLDTRLQQLANNYSPVHYFNQLDIILKFTKKINLDIPLNPTLALETLLMGYI
jgi:DNA polymerase III subunit delta'